MKDEILIINESGNVASTKFTNIKNFTSMFYQNKEYIFMKYPYFQYIFYEYLSALKLNNELKLLSLLEDFIVFKNLKNLSLTEIQNFVKSMSRNGRSRKKIMNQLKKHLDREDIYQNLSRNISICSSFANVCALSNGEDDDYLHKSLTEIHNQIISQHQSGISLIGETGKINISKKFIVTNVTLRIIFNFCVKSLVSTDLKYTEEEVNKIFIKQKFIKMGEIELPVIEGQLLNLKECILLSIFQYAHVFKEKNAKYSELVLLKYINKVHPQIAKYCPELENSLNISETAFRETIVEQPKVLMSQTEHKIANILNEIGVFYYVHHRVEDVFKAMFYLPNSRTIFEYLQIIDLLKTDNTERDRVIGFRYLIRNKILEAHGYKVVNIDSFDFINTKNDHFKIIDIIKSKLELK